LIEDHNLEWALIEILLNLNESTSNEILPNSGKSTPTKIWLNQFQLKPKVEMDPPQLKVNPSLFD